MIRITVYQHSDGRCIGFDCCGHAEYSEPGSDIVCAAVSGLVITIINSLEMLTKEQFTNTVEEESGTIRLRMKTSGHDSQLLLSAMLLGLNEMEDNYREYIDLIYEEVQET